MIDALRKLIAIPSITDATAEGKPFGKNVNDALVYMLNFCQGFGLPHEKLRQLPGFC